VKNIVHRLVFHRIMDMSLWPHFLARPVGAYEGTRNRIDLMSVSRLRLITFSK